MKLTAHVYELLAAPYYNINWSSDVMSSKYFFPLCDGAARISGQLAKFVFKPMASDAYLNANF